MSNSHIPWLDFAAAQLGTRAWIVAPTLTPKMRREGYERGIKAAAFAKLRSAWIDQHPGVLAAMAIDRGNPKRAWLIDAARSYAETLATSAGSAGEVSAQDRSIALHRQLCGLGG
tara:strand:- start:22350 stop:22694 length:345 start_codon:yes stop_codon:yes gene_type:complete